MIVDEPTFQVCRMVHMQACYFSSHVWRFEHF